MEPEARRFPGACVASPHYLASAAGLAVLADGGNALDAAIATNLTLGVVVPYLCGFGGDVFAIVWDGTKVHGYNGSGRAGSAADPAAVGDEMPSFGPQTVTVPGAVEGWFTLLERFGTRSFEELARPALRYARDGLVLTRKGAEIVGFSQNMYGAEPWGAEWRRIYGDAGAGRRLLQPDLARTIERLSTAGPDVFYRGEIAEGIAQAVPLLTPDDLDAHTGDWVETLTTSYRGVDVHELPPNTQGVAALEALNIVSGFDPGEPDTPERMHLEIEAMKLALADRDVYVTDPDHMVVDPAVLASQEWATQRRTVFDLERACTPEPGRPASGGTVYLCAADADGMCVSLIQSNYVGFGSGVTVSGWGINLQNRGSYFSLDRGHVNVIAPGKRTMHTLVPGMAFRDGAPWLVFGTMGGDGQAQTHLQVLRRVIDDDTDVQQAIHAPRWVVSPGDWSVAVESRTEGSLVEALRTRGHAVDVRRPFDTGMGHAHAILRTHEGDLACATDPRAEGAALGL